MAASNDRARKLLVRTAVVTSTTIATLIGAQNLAMLDSQQFQLTLTPNVADISMDLATAEVTVETTVHAAPQIEIRHAAPSITVLRQSGQRAVTQPVSAANAPIQPPIPAQIAAPPPVIVQQQAQTQQQVQQPQQQVQQPAPQRSRSSR